MLVSGGPVSGDPISAAPIPLDVWIFAPRSFAAPPAARPMAMPRRTTIAALLADDWVPPSRARPAGGRATSTTAFLRPRLCPALLPGFTDFPPFPEVVAADESLEKRSRSHEQATAEILNDLFRRRRLLREAGAWSLAYTPGDPGSWTPPLPETVGEALERIVDVARSLGALP